MPITRIILSGVLALLANGACGANTPFSSEAPWKEAEYQKLLPHLDEACAVVRQDPRVFPYRVFPFGPLSLEIRKAADVKEANLFHNFHLGVAAGRCGITPKQSTAFFFCGPECPAGRKNHLVASMPRVRALATVFDKLADVRLLAVWVPIGELRVNDVFFMEGAAREAIPSPTMGFVPSGEWKPWPSLGAYLATVGLTQDQLSALTEQMLAIGLSGLVREPTAIRFVGVGVGDNESGLLQLRPGTPVPRVGGTLSDRKELSIVEDLGGDFYYYETN